MLTFLDEALDDFFGRARNYGIVLGQNRRWRNRPLELLAVSNLQFCPTLLLPCFTHSLRYFIGN